MRLAKHPGSFGAVTREVDSSGGYQCYHWSTVSKDVSHAADAHVACSLTGTSYCTIITKGLVLWLIRLSSVANFSEKHVRSKAPEWSMTGTGTRSRPSQSSL